MVLTPFTTIFQLYEGSHFYLWMKTCIHEEKYRSVTNH
jgi:hypothetical protein